MSKPLVLTCDIGTQSARALLVDPDGRIVDVVQSKYAEPYFSKEPGWAEQKPNFYFDRLCECCRELCARSNALLPDVIAMTITGIRDTVVCLDANNEPLRDIILWLDKRTVDPNGAMPAKNMMLFKVAGMEPTAKVVYAASVGNWIMRHEPELWARTAKYVMLPTNLNYKLTGNLIDSASNQIGHIPFDYKNRRWMKPGSLTRCFCDVPNEKLCALVPSGTVIGTVTDEVCALTGIPAGLPLPDDPAVADSAGTIRSYEFARDIRKDIEGNPFAGKLHPVPVADYKICQQATPDAYHAALLHKQALSRQVDAFFASLQVDFLLLPVAFSTAPSINAPQEAFTAGRTLVNLFSVAGVPTLVVPGELTAGGMPLGIQLVGPALRERLLLDAGTAYETTYGPITTPPLASA